MGDLNSWVREQLKKGYKLSTLRDYLLKYGYLDEQIDKVFDELNHTEQRIVHHHHFSVSISTMVGLFLLLGLGFFGYNYFYNTVPSQLFDLETSLITQVPESGGLLVFNVELSNLGEMNRLDAFLEHSLVDSDGNVLTIKEETVAVETRASIRSSIVLPELKEGNYQLKTIARYDGQKAIASFMFSIKDGEEVVTKLTTTTIPSTTFENVVTTTTNDVTTTTNDVTTTSSSIIPVTTTTTTTVEPNCFDGIKNQDETGVDCGGSCKECKVDCNIISDDVDRDECFFKEAKENQNPDICESLIDIEKRDDCYMWFFLSDVFEVNGDFICDRIIDTMKRDSCASLYEIYS